MEDDALTRINWCWHQYVDAVSVIDMLKFDPPDMMSTMEILGFDRSTSRIRSESYYYVQDSAAPPLIFEPVITGMDSSLLRAGNAREL